MRLLFYCPLNARIGHHIREFFRFKSHNAYRKYHFFISQFMNNPNKKTAIFCDFKGIDFLYFRIKCVIWMLINLINPFRVKILNNADSLNPNNDVLLSFPFLSFSQQALNPDSVFFKFNGLKSFHFSHYFERPELLCPFINSQNNTLMIGEANLNINPLYSKFIKNRPFYILPFVLRDRYKNLCDFSSRKQKCFACGTKSKTSPTANKEFNEIFQANYLHKLRVEIHTRKLEISDFIDCFIFDYNEAADFQPKTRWEKITSRVEKIIGSDRKRFFAFDIVKKYNEYQMFVSPEEESGAPSISFIEGMACGCAYFGRAEIYEGYGLIPGTHFVAYDGSLDDLIAKIKTHTTNTEELRQIAKNGQLFVENHFRAEIVAEKFWSFLETTKSSHQTSF